MTLLYFGYFSFVYDKSLDLSKKMYYLRLCNSLMCVVYKRFTYFLSYFDKFSVVSL